MYGGGDRMKIDSGRMLIDYIQPNEKQYFFLKCLIHDLKGKVSNNVAKILEEIMDEKPSI